MAKVTYNDILDGISLALHTAYPTACIYSGTIEQGISPGDFNIINVTTAQEHKLGARFTRTAVFDVVYYGLTADSSEYTGIANDLMLLLDDIVVASTDILHAVSLAGKVDTDEKALHVTVTYAVQVYIPGTGTAMEELAIVQEGQ